MPAYQEAFGSEPLRCSTRTFDDAVNILMDAVEAVARTTTDVDPRQLRDEVFATSGYDGVTGIASRTELGDCATDVTIGVFLAPGWPVEGGTDEPAVYSDTKSLDDVL